MPNFGVAIPNFSSGHEKRPLVLLPDLAKITFSPTTSLITCRAWEGEGKYFLMCVLLVQAVIIILFVIILLVIIVTN